MSDENPFIYPGMPNSVPAVREAMMRGIGIRDIEELYAVIPEQLRFRGSLGLPDPIPSEMALRKHVEARLARNSSCAEKTSFLGAGCYRHYVPAICDEINSRSEFISAYCGDTYSDHGKLQAVFEYTSLMGELLDMDVVSYTTFDGGQAAASALRMAARITGRQEVLIPATMNPEIASQLRDYGRRFLTLVTVDPDPRTGRINLADLAGKLSDRTAAVFIENPSYLGIFEEGAQEISDLAHRAGALSVIHCDPISLGVLETPAALGADIACGEIQSLGMHLLYGGGCAGYIATRDEPRFINEIPTYLYGIMEARTPGQYGFGRALNYRTSHGSREKAREYFGTGSGLWAITAGVYLSLMGPKGMKELGETILYKTNYAISQLSSLPGVWAPRFASYHFREFVVDFNKTGQRVADINRRLLAKDIFGGKDLSADFPYLGQCALYCVTELTDREDLDRLVTALWEILA
jgi:glycine dehydrogenase subunit 1